LAPCSCVEPPTLSRLRFAFFRLAFVKFVFLRSTPRSCAPQSQLQRDLRKEIAPI
jgi:hypothetical protein